MKQIFINLPVSDLEKSKLFYTALGFELNPLFTDKNQVSLHWSDSILIMLQTHQFANSYLKKEVINAKNQLSVSHTLPVDSALMVDELIHNALTVGGVEPVATIIEKFMYLRSIEDLDGHLWGIMYLDTEAFKSLKGR